MPQSPVKSPRLSSSNEAAAPPDSCSITIKEDENEQEKENEKQKEERENAERESDRVLNERDKFTRSHSTGHSIRNGGDGGGDDRFTLILPEEVKSRIIRGHNSSKSWTDFGEYKKEKITKNGSDAEASGVAAGDDKV